MAESIDHDRLFKELISTFFVEFIELFFPQVITYLDGESITFLDKEIFTDVTQGEKFETDLIAQVKFQQQESFFLVHVEAQSSSDNSFNRRMFTYFSALHQKFSLPVYPIVIFSYDSPLKEAESEYQVEFPDFKVLQFNYRKIQLNRLNWKDYLNQNNPIASALMSKMQIAQKDRPKVKAQCLRLLANLKLDPARMQLISGFVDTYLKLNQLEESEFKQEISTFSQPEKEKVMQITTSWMEQGLEQGLEQGIERGLTREKELVLRQLKRKLGQIAPGLESQIKALNIDIVESLGEALLDFNSENDLKAWLASLQLL